MVGYFYLLVVFHITLQFYNGFFQPADGKAMDGDNGYIIFFRDAQFGQTVLATNRALAHIEYKCLAIRVSDNPVRLFDGLPADHIFLVNPYITAARLKPRHVRAHFLSVDAGVAYEDVRVVQFAF
jgi:hypothetical protein